MPLRLTLVIDYNSAPTNLAQAASHKGGWTESVWFPGDTLALNVIQNYAFLRARLLPKTTKIVGYKLQTFTAVFLGLKAGGVAEATLNQTGNTQYDCDIPQMALECKSTTANAINTRKFSLRGIPDNQVEFGEYQPKIAFQGALQNFFTNLRTSGFAFVGRDLTKATVKVIKIAAGVMTVSDVSQLTPGKYIRLLKVKDVNGKLVSGRWIAGNIVSADNTVVLQGFNTAINVGLSGSARTEEVAVYTINNSEYTRIGVRKVGAPFEKYRGRRSKTTNRI